MRAACVALRLKDGRGPRLHPALHPQRSVIPAYPVCQTVANHATLRTQRRNRGSIQASSLVRRMRIRLVGGCPTVLFLYCGAWNQPHADCPHQMSSLCSLPTIRPHGKFVQLFQNFYNRLLLRQNKTFPLDTLPAPSSKSNNLSDSSFAILQKHIFGSSGNEGGGVGRLQGHRPGLGFGASSFPHHFYKKTRHMRKIG